MGHKGTCEPQSHKDAATHLTAAVFGLRYAEFLSAKVDQALAAGTLPAPPAATAPPLKQRAKGRHK